jgi:PPE-repeat protein
LTILTNPFLAVLSPDDFPSIIYPLIQPAIAPGLAVASLGSAGGFAGLAELAAAPSVPVVESLTPPVLAPVAAAPVALSLAGASPTVIASSVAPGTAPAPAPAHVTSTVASSAAPPAPPAAVGAGFVPPYAVGPPGIGFDSGMSASAKSSARRKAPEPDSVAAATAAAARQEARARRRRRTILRDHGDEFADMNIDVEPDWDGPLASDQGAGPLGFAGTVRKEAVEQAAGLTTLAGDEFGGGPTVPMMPGSWEPDGH